MTLSVVGPGGPICDVTLGTTATVRELKATIVASAGIPASSQRLFRGLDELTGPGSLGELLPDLARDEELLLVQENRCPERARWLELIEETFDPMEMCNQLMSAPAAIKQDKEVILAAMQRSPLVLRCASEELKADRDIVMAIIATGYMELVFDFASEDLKADRDIAMAAVAKDWRAMNFLSEELKADRDIVMAAIAQDWRALEFAPAQHRADRDVVTAATAQSRWALRFASVELQAEIRGGRVS